MAQSRESMSEADRESDPPGRKSTNASEKVNILLVDDQITNLLSYELILKDLGENIVKATSGQEALGHLLKTEFAVVLLDVCMPGVDGFELAAMLREHPRFENTAIIFVSAIQLSDVDRLRGYEMGAVDYVPVPVVPEVLRAKVKVFANLYRKTRQLERLNCELEERVAARTAELEFSTEQLRQSEHRRSLALAASNMGSWDWNSENGDCLWDEGQFGIFGVDPRTFTVTAETVRPLIVDDDWNQLTAAADEVFDRRQAVTREFRVRRPDGKIRWCVSTAAATVDASGRVLRISGVTADITDRKEAETRQALLAREVDHRAKNALALVQAVIRLTRASDVETFIAGVEGRIKALSRVHTILSQSRWQGADLAGLVDEELAPYRTGGADRVTASGPAIFLAPEKAQTLALALHELVGNSAKYGALSSVAGRVIFIWKLNGASLDFYWEEEGGPQTTRPSSSGFGTRIVVATIEQQLRGKVSFDWNPKGLRCTISIPHGRAAESSARVTPVAANAEDRPAGQEKFAVAGNRIMVVEDEALVAMVVGESLAGLGREVVGPFSRCAEAIAAINAGDVDAAVLDVNLGGELVYPVAEVLLARSIPFVFVTGYGIDGIDGRFRSVPVIQKPVDEQSLRRYFAPQRLQKNPTHVVRQAL